MTAVNLPEFPALYKANNITELTAVMLQELTDSEASEGEYEYLTIKEANKRFRDFTAQMSCGLLAMLAKERMDGQSSQA